MKVTSITKGTNTATLVIVAEFGDSEEQVRLLREFRSNQAKKSKKIEPAKDEITVTVPMQW